MHVNYLNNGVLTIALCPVTKWFIITTCRHFYWDTPTCMAIRPMTPQQEQQQSLTPAALHARS